MGTDTSNKATMTAQTTMIAQDTTKVLMTMSFTRAKRRQKIQTDYRRDKDDAQRDNKINCGDYQNNVDYEKSPTATKEIQLNV